MRSISLIAAAHLVFAAPAFAQEEEFDFEFDGDAEETATEDAAPTQAAEPSVRSPRPPAEPPEGPAPSLTIAAPRSLVLGSGGAAPVEVHFSPPPKHPMITSSVGRITALTDRGGGRFSAQLLLPDDTEQVLALVSAWDEHHPGPPEVHRIRLERAEDVEIRPGLRVATVVVPGRLRSDWKRPAQVFVFVHNRKGKAQDTEVKISAERGSVGPLQQTNKGTYTAEYTPPTLVGTALDQLAITPAEGLPGWAEIVVDGVSPAPARVTLSPERIRADGEAQTTIRLELTTTDGRPLTGQVVSFDPLDGEVGDVVEEAPGVYEAEYTAPDALPPEGNTDVTAIIGEAISGEERLQHAFPIPLIAGPASKAQIYSEPARVPADGATPVKIYVSLTDATGNPAEGTPEIRLDAEGPPGPAKALSVGNWVFSWVPPQLPELEFTRRVQVLVRVGGRRIPTRGKLRLVPQAKPDVPQGRPLADEFWSAELGVATLIGGSDLGAANGLSVEAGWLSRISDTSLFAGFTPSIKVVGSSVEADDDAHMDPAFTSGVRADVTQTLAPLLATVLLQVQPSVHFDVYGGLSGGLLVAHARAASDVAFGGVANSLSVLGAVAIPVGVEVPIGDGAITAQAQYFRSLGRIEGAGADGTVGVAGTIEGLSMGAGWRWGQW